MSNKIKRFCQSYGHLCSDSKCQNNLNCKLTCENCSSNRVPVPRPPTKSKVQASSKKSGGWGNSQYLSSSDREQIIRWQKAAARKK